MGTPLTITWDEMAARRWTNLCDAASAPPAQHWTYGAALVRLGADVRRAVITRPGAGEHPLALAQFTARRFGPVGMALCTHGPVWLRSLPIDERAAVLSALRRAAPPAGLRAVLFTPAETDSDAVRAARMVRMVSGQSHAVLDVDQDDETLMAGMQGKWRNRLRQALRADITSTAVTGKASAWGWLVQHEAAQRIARGYRALPPQFLAAFQAEAGGRGNVLVQRHGPARAPEAGMAFLRQGESALYHLGWASPSARASGGHAVVLWDAIRRLRAAGVRRLYLGAIDTAEGAGLARFKLGCGARPVTYCGSYI